MDACPRCNTPWSQQEFCPNDGMLRRAGVTVGDRYELDRLIGIGGMGHVFAARHKLLGKAVAIKILRPELSRDATQVARFLREAQLSSQLQHESIVTITDFGRDAATANLYLVMELLVGDSLASVIAAEGPLPLGRATSVLRQVCRALAAAHQGGVVHRDLTPRNVFLTEQSGRRDFVKLLDFGISRLAGGQDRVTATGVAVGTTAYMPPEQLRGEVTQDHRVDLYALGVMAHEMLTARVPFKARSSAALIAEKLSGQPLELALGEVRERHAGLAGLIAECMADEPSRRPASAAEVEQRLLASSGTDVGQSEREDLAGLRAGSYRVVRLLGAGGIGSVWLGEHPVIGSRVAIKVLHSQFVEHAEAVQRFVTEAQAVNRIASPHIVKIFDFGKLADGRDYAVMELLEGEALGARLLRQGRLAWPEARSIALQALRGLSAAHRAGVVHRDLKPDNIFLTGEPDAPGVKILDFGIAKLLAGAESAVHQTQLGVGIGTPLYAAPEQAAGQAVTPAADVYALGVVLYEVLSGQAPFGGSLTELLCQKMSADPPSIAARVAGLDPQVAGIITAMLSRDPATRPGVEQLLTLLEEQGDPGRETSRHTPTLLWGSAAGTGSFLPPAEERLLLTPGSLSAAEPPRRQRRWPALAVGAFLLGAALLLGAGGAVLVALRRPVRPPASVALPAPAARLAAAARPSAAARNATAPATPTSRPSAVRAADLPLPRTFAPSPTPTTSGQISAVHKSAPAGARGAASRRSPKRAVTRATAKTRSSGQRPLLANPFED